MKVSLIQAPLEWENAKANRDYFERQISTKIGSTDLIVLPEMFSTGFTMKPQEVSESMEGETIQWLKVLSKKKNCAITGSLVISENGKFRNRLVFVFPSGELQFYDKRHLFTLAGEDKVYTAGNEKLIVNYLGWKICPLICYDLRFPVFSRNTEDYDLLIYVANWPKPRVAAWDALLKARAIENMSYVIGVNRFGADNNGLEYIGHSQIVDFLGDYIAEPDETEVVLTAQLDREKMLEAREKLAFLNDRDSFTVN